MVISGIFWCDECLVDWRILSYNYYLAALPILPLTLECGVELTFPIPEVVTNGLLMAFGQAFGVLFTFIADTIQDPVTQSIT